MRSFAIWYQSKNDKYGVVNADFHINFWSNLNYQFYEDICFFDFGIKVENLENVKDINIYCPFNLNKDDIRDLGGRISNNSLINAIFNEDYSVIDGVPKHFIVQGINTQKANESIREEAMLNTNEAFVVYALNVDSEVSIEKCSRQKCKNDNPRKNVNTWGSIITIHTEKLLSNATGVAKDINCYYFRIRVKTTKSALSLITRDLKNVNILKDALEGIELMDFRINDIRSCCDEVRDRFNFGGKFFVKSIHYLVMRDINEDVVVDGTPYRSRLLEQDIWNKYIDELKDNMIAYHFKKKISKDCVEGIDNLVLLLKFRYRSVTKQTVLLYLGFIILFEILINWFCSLIFE